MKIAFTTSGENLDSPPDSRFGRAPKLLAYNLDDDSFVVINNDQNVNAAQGAGVQTAEFVARQGIDCLITGHCGPKAFQVLSAAGIKIYTSESATDAAALDAFRAGSLKSVDSADVGGHW